MGGDNLQATQMEAIGRHEYTKNPESRDPISASLFYLALRKKHIVLTFWRQAGGHDDQRSILKFLVNDFELPRWKTAALKNAYALLSKRRFCKLDPRYAVLLHIMLIHGMQYSRQSFFCSVIV